MRTLSCKHIHITYIHITYIHITYIYTYIYKVFNDHSKRVLGVMIGTHFTLPGLGVAMMANRIAHFYKWKFANKGRQIFRRRRHSTILRSSVGSWLRFASFSLYKEAMDF